MALGPGQPETSGQGHRVSEEWLQALDALWEHARQLASALTTPQCAASLPLPCLPGKHLPLLLQALWTAIPALTGSSLWAETSHVCQGGMTPTEDTRGPRRGHQERGHTHHPRSRDVTVLLKWKRLFPFPQFLLGRSGGGGLGRRGRKRRRRGISVKFPKWKQARNVNSTEEKENCPMAITNSGC